MVKSTYSSYFKLLDASWKQFSNAHPNTDPSYCLVSQDVEDFLDAEQIAFLCPIVVDSEMPAQTMCLVHVANQT
jgi:hypothetical protein